MTQPGYPPVYPAPRPAPNGSLPWGLGLLVLIPIPFLSALIASVAMIVSARTRAQQAPTARENANRAANWGLTYLLATVLLMGTHFTVLFISQDIQGFFPFGLIVLTWVGFSIVHLVFSIIGLVQASQGRRVPLNGLPIFR